jgi:hypothetical protein
VRETMKQISSKMSSQMLKPNESAMQMPTTNSTTTPTPREMQTTNSKQTRTPTTIQT